MRRVRERKRRERKGGRRGKRKGEEEDRVGREGFTDKSIEYRRRKKKGDSPRAHIMEKEVFWVCSPVPQEVEAERPQFQGA